MLVISRFAVDDADETAAAVFLGRARAALDAFAARPGFRRGRVGRSADDPALWAITTEWDGVGAFRRSLSAYDVKLHAAPLLAESLDEPSAYEVLVALDGGAGAGAATTAPSGRSADAGTTRVGEAAVPYAPRSPPDPA